MDDVVKLFLGIFVVVAFSLSYFLKKLIPYTFCPLEKYEGKYFKGKTHKFFMLHFVISFGLCIYSFLLLNNIDIVKSIFNNDIIRIVSFFIVWIVKFTVVGLIIEFYLTKTDKEYRTWKMGIK